MNISRPLVLLAVLAAPLAAQDSLSSTDSILARILRIGEDSSRVQQLAQVLLDSIGPRLTGATTQKAASDWLLRTYRGWGIPARHETYGTWHGWRRGTSHLDLIAPRVHSLEATMLGYSPGTNPVTRPNGPRGRAVLGPPRTVEGSVVMLPDAADSADFARLLRGVRGKFVMISAPDVVCRPPAVLRQFATEKTYREIAAKANATDSLWRARIQRTGYDRRSLPAALERAGAAGLLSSDWTGASGTMRVFTTRTQRIPAFAVGCEDYALLARLAENRQGPRVRARADAERLGEQPVWNTIAELRGVELPNEYVMLSAHFDSFDAASGATDNGTGTVMMMEAMRILKAAYPNPKRTILVGHWVGEEFGLIGSGAFAADHPDIVSGLHALFNQDGGTGRIASISLGGMARAGEWWKRWLARLPASYREFRLDDPGRPSSGGSDHASFLCHGAPGFALWSVPYDYDAATWHTNRDTFDKVDLNDLRFNATLVAALAYLAAEDTERMPRDRAVNTDPRTGETRPWPACAPIPRKSSDSTR